MLYLSFAFLPVMLCAIPCIHICCGSKSPRQAEDDEFVNSARQDEEESQRLLQDNQLDSVRDNSFTESMESVINSHREKEHQDTTGEVFIHQIIETIEFVLGCISNTASYLRLWALSLAHGQLGEVFLTQIFGNPYVFPYKLSTPAAIFYFFILSFPFMCAIVAVLLMMDVLEVFLHTMRLHWVEFMGKFY